MDSCDIHWAESLGFKFLDHMICAACYPGSYFKVLGDNISVVEEWANGHRILNARLSHATSLALPTWLITLHPVYIPPHITSSLEFPFTMIFFPSLKTVTPSSTSLPCCSHSLLANLKWNRSIKPLPVKLVSLVRHLFDFPDFPHHHHTHPTPTSMKQEPTSFCALLSLTPL